jgi:hypothetical protein
MSGSMSTIDSIKITHKKQTTVRIKCRREDTSSSLCVKKQTKKGREIEPIVLNLADIRGDVLSSRSKQ